MWVCSEERVVFGLVVKCAEVYIVCTFSTMKLRVLLCVVYGLLLLHLDAIAHFFITPDAAIPVIPFRLE